MNKIHNANNIKGSPFNLYCGQASEIVGFVQSVNEIEQVANAKEREMSITFEQAHKDCGWLGRVKTIHSVGDFDVVEYAVNKAKWKDTTYDTGFSGFIDGKSVGETWTSLDRALIGLICRKYDGLNSRAAYYIFDMIRMKDPESAEKQSAA